MNLVLIAALTKNRVIGVNGEIPWHIPEDLKRFSKITTDHPVIMGRKTYESIPDKYRPLSNRTNIVLSRNSEFNPHNSVIVCNSIDDAIQSAESIDELVFGIGGQQIYEQLIERADKLELTVLHRELTESNKEDKEYSYFPPYKQDNTWKNVWHRNNGSYSYMTYLKQR